MLRGCPGRCWGLQMYVASMPRRRVLHEPTGITVRLPGAARAVLDQQTPLQDPCPQLLPWLPEPDQERHAVTAHLCTGLASRHGEGADSFTRLVGVRVGHPCLHIPTARQQELLLWGSSVGRGTPHLADSWPCPALQTHPSITRLPGAGFGLPFPQRCSGSRIDTENGRLTPARPQCLPQAP